MTEIMLGKRTIPMIFTTLELKDVLAEIGPVTEIQEKLQNVFQKPEELETLGKLIVIMGNAGLEERGEAADLTVKKVLRAMKPHQINDMISSCMDAFLEGMLTENTQKDKEDDSPVDEGLEMLNKKNESGT